MAKSSIIDKYRKNSLLFVGDKVVFYENDIAKTIRLATVSSMHIDLNGRIWFYLEWFENGTIGTVVEHKHLSYDEIRSMMDNGTLQKL